MFLTMQWLIIWVNGDNRWSATSLIKVTGILSKPVEQSFLSCLIALFTISDVVCCILKESVLSAKLLMRSDMFMLFSTKDMRLAMEAK